MLAFPTCEGFLRGNAGIQSLVLRSNFVSERREARWPLADVASKQPSGERRAWPGAASPGAAQAGPAPGARGEPLGAGRQVTGSCGACGGHSMGGKKAGRMGHWHCHGGAFRRQRSGWEQLPRPPLCGVLPTPYPTAALSPRYLGGKPEGQKGEAGPPHEACRRDLSCM